MIVIGYPGIGKTSVTKTNVGYIDYDSSLFEKVDGWEKDYVEAATNLSKWGNVVFVSSHKTVQELLLKSSEIVVVIYPSLMLHDFWINKLKTRYAKTGNEAEHRALIRCVCHYCEDILELQESEFKNKIEITDEDYKLEDLLAGIQNGSST